MSKPTLGYTTHPVFFISVDLADTVKMDARAKYVKLAVLKRLRNRFYRTHYPADYF
jgi:hypothetical protein